jgi:hypothetical protein
MNNHLIIADAHVHLYQCFSFEHLFDSTIKNFQRALDHPKSGAPFDAFLFLAEGKEEDGFYRLSQLINEPAGNVKVGRWTLIPTKEEVSLYVRLNEDKGLYIIAGLQIKTKENLEVLALGTIQNFKEGYPIEELIPDISRSGAIPVIPWGVGKWIGRRGGIVKDLMKNGNSSSFFLGDNRNRPLFWLRPRLFIQAEQKGLPVLPGSDPLPHPSEIRHVGRYGFKLQGSIDPDYPFREIKKLLLDPTIKLQAYGSLENPGRFFWNQMRFRLMKRKAI